jgi:hypothetical protein
MRAPKFLENILPFLLVTTCIILTNQIAKAQSSVQIGSGNELFFLDNGQIRCLDNNHRILFRRSENIMEFREFGSIHFSSGAENGQQTSKMFLGSNGNLGLGTTGPRSKLDIWGGILHVTGPDINGTLLAGAQAGYAWIGNDYLNNGISISPTGQIGVGTSTQHALVSLGSGGGKRFLVYDDPDVNGSQLGFGINMSGNIDELSIFHSTKNGNDGDISFGKRQNGTGTYTEAMRITGAGNVGIGTTDTKTYKFAVNGSAIFTKVVVKEYNNWPDYVFQPNYRLRPLGEVEKYINDHHHLPEVVSAEEVQKNGLDISENQAALLKKIEELTLYVIEQEKKIKAQDQKQAVQDRQFKLMQEQISQLKELLKNK